MVTSRGLVEKRTQDIEIRYRLYVNYSDYSYSYLEITLTGTVIVLV